MLLVCSARMELGCGFGNTVMGCSVLFISESKVVTGKNGLKKVLKILELFSCFGTCQIIVLSTIQPVLLVAGCL